jgi:hypothetical protein
MSLGTAAIDAAKNGLRVFPVVPRGKKPLRRGWLSNATTDLDVIECTWHTEPDANIGVATGRNLVVVDVDSEAGHAALLDHGGLPPTPTVATGRGQHMYFSGKAKSRNALL